MEYRRPACDNISVHPEHWDPLAGMGGSHCPGWTEAEADTAALIGVLNQAAWQLAQLPVPPDGVRLVDGVRLECHPSVPYILMGMVIPGYAEFVSGTEPWKPQFPVLVSAEMKPGEWRLVLADGRIREEPAERRP